MPTADVQIATAPPQDNIGLRGHASLKLYLKAQVVGKLMMSY